MKFGIQISATTFNFFLIQLFYKPLNDVAVHKLLYHFAILYNIFLPKNCVPYFKVIDEP